MVYFDSARDATAPRNHIETSIDWKSAITNVHSMPSHSTDGLQYESYTTPRSLALESASEKLNNGESEAETDRSSVPSTREVIRRDGARSAPSHFSQQVSQNLTERLLDNSEMTTLEDSLYFESSVFDDWGEAASGWRVVCPYPKYVSQPPPARHKSETVLKKGSVGVRATVRCIDEDFGGEHLCPSWKGNVEPVTYRYVPNNGYYRNHKPIRDVREWPMMKKTKSEKSRLTPEMRQAQKTLKRDLDNHFRGLQDDYTSASVHGTDAVQYEECVVKPPQSYADHITHIPKRLPFREQQLIKSASDLFMENFNSRLSALEKEIQIPNVPAVSKKQGESSAVPNHSPTQLSKKLKEVRVPESVKPTIQSTRQHADNFGDDLFTVIPMCKPEVPLRPLEKLTPKQKQMEKSSNTSRERSPSPHPPSTEEEEDDLMIVLACATSQPPTLPKDADSSGISTARSAIAMTNFDIEKMRNIPLRANFSGKPKPFLLHKDSGGTRGGRPTMRYTVNGGSGHAADQSSSTVSDSEKKDLLPVERQIDRNLDSMGSTLPEIMGKRLSVITATHRLL